MHWIDITIIVVYLVGMVWTGLAARGRQETSSDYFNTSGGMGGFLGTIMVGLSLAATLFSGISFMIFPSVTYSYGLKVLSVLLSFPICWLVVNRWFIPRYLQGPVGHPYEVIERQFGNSVRMTVSTLFVIMRLGWMASLIYAPTLLVMSTMRLESGWLWPLILLTGITCTFYSAFGGIRGVIVTDALQMLVIMGSVLVMIVFVIWKLPVPLLQALGELRVAERLRPVDWNLDPSVPFTIWTVLFAMTFSNLGNYLGDQMALQRYMASSSVSNATRSFTVNLVGASIVIVQLVIVGLALTIWYRYFPDPLLPMKNGAVDADRLFPHFASTQLPTGLVGLLVAAVLAATMSSITSGINALSGSLTNDFLRVISKDLPDRQLLAFGRFSSLAIGIAATLAAGMVSRLGTLFELTQTLLGVFLGPLAACMILAVFRVPARAGAVLAGLGLGSALGCLCAFTKEVHPMWIAPVSFAPALILPLLAALAGGWKRRATPAGSATMAPLPVPAQEKGR